MSNFEKPLKSGAKSEKYLHLPAPVRLEDTVTSLDTNPVPDPDAGQTPDTLFLIRYGAL